MGTKYVKTVIIISHNLYVAVALNPHGTVRAEEV